MSALVPFIGIAILVLGIILYLYLFFRARKKMAGMSIAPEWEDEKGGTFEETEPTDTKIFKAVDTGSDETGSAFGYDAQTVVKNVSFEDKLGKDTVTVELPAKKQPRRVTRKAATKKVAVKQPVEAKPLTRDEAIAILANKIVRRTKLLKIANRPAAKDVTLAKYKADLAALKKARPTPVEPAVEPKAVTPAKKVPVKKRTGKKVPSKKGPAKKIPAKKSAKKQA